MTKIAVLSASGGMDSTALLLHLLGKGCEVHAFSFNYGQKHIVELKRLQKNIQYLASMGYVVGHTTIDLQNTFASFHSALTDSSIPMPEGYYAEENMKKTVVPNRNAIFASILFGHALNISVLRNQSVQMSMGVHSGDHAIYPDCRPQFHTDLFNTFCSGNWQTDKVSLYLPYIHENKHTILQDALQNCQDLGLNFDIVFRNTNTSYEPDETGRSSGRTGADVERILAFHALGRVDPVPYQHSWDEVLAYALEKEREYLHRQMGG